MKGSVRRRAERRLGVPVRRGLRPAHRTTPPPGTLGLQDQAGSRAGAASGDHRAREGARRPRPPHAPSAQFLEEWHAAIKASVRPTTWVNYRNYMTPTSSRIIGETRLQDLTPVRLNLLYAHLLDHGRVRGGGGAGARRPS